MSELERLRYHQKNANDARFLDIEYLHEIFGRSADEIESLQAKLAAAEKERDEWRQHFETQSEKQLAPALHRAKAAEQERDDAVAAMSRHANRVLTEQRDEARAERDALRSILADAAELARELVYWEREFKGTRAFFPTESEKKLSRMAERASILGRYDPKS